MNANWGIGLENHFGAEKCDEKIVGCASLNRLPRRMKHPAFLKIGDDIISFNIMYLELENSAKA